MKKIEKTAKGWRLKGGNLILDIDGASGELKSLIVDTGRKFVWTPDKGTVSVSDDFTGKKYTGKDIKRIKFELKGDVLTLSKYFKDAPFLLTEKYSVEDEVIHWTSRLDMDKGEFRSCSIVYSIPWPQPAYGNNLWAAKDNMPSELGRFGGFAFEYGEITSGILIPALCAWRKKEDAGLLLAMPFDFKAPRFRFVGGFREPALYVRYDWLALKAGKPAEASLLLRAASGGWRPSLGWLYKRFREYFEPRSKNIHNLWGGHICGTYDVPLKKARIMAELGCKWHEIHAHFPFYGNYHPEGMKSWSTGHPMRVSKAHPDISVELIKKSIKNLHNAGVAAMPYIQVAGDGDDKLPAAILNRSLIKDIYGEKVSAWPGTHMMNSDLSLPFGKDMVRQIKGMVSRYPEMDGVFLDQACYNFLDTAHSDGITAVGNRPAYMTGFNYAPQLELLSGLLHPEKVIIGNGPFSIGIMKYIDGFMAECESWLNDHLQYYAIAKPMFFLTWGKSGRSLEKMFQSCIFYGAGFTSNPEVYKSSKDIFDMYMPVLQLLYRRRWVFENNPIEVPYGYKGSLFSSSRGTLVAGIVSETVRTMPPPFRSETVHINAKAAKKTHRVVLHEPGQKPRDIKFSCKEEGLEFDVPGATVAAVAELITA
ncbi:MAG: hypothetical protein JW957_03640 [Candidatus Omnitrophica bacterium]|nr:hypothetical protein [Candidatus Omnitrophota bacterium]